MTFPSKPNAASGQAGGRRALGSGGGRWPGGERTAAGAKVGARRGLALGADRAFRHSGAWARLRLGFRAAGSASFALQVPVTHRHSRPPLALTRSPPPPPPRRPNPPARPDRSGSERARRAPGEGGRGGVGGAGRAGTWSLQTAAGGDSVAWERASRGSRRSLGAQVGGGGGGEGWRRRDPGEGLTAAHFGPFLSLVPSRAHLHSQADVPGTQRTQGPRGQDAPALLLQLRGTAPLAAPRPPAEVAPATRSDAPGS